MLSQYLRHVTQSESTPLCKLNQTIYGLKHTVTSNMLWLQTHYDFKRTMTSFGLICYKFNPSFFYRAPIEDVNIKERLWLHFLDEKLIWLHNLQTQFTLKDMGRPNCFWGIEFTYQSRKMVLSWCKCVRLASRDHISRLQTRGIYLGW